LIGVSKQPIDYPVIGIMEGSIAASSWTREGFPYSLGAQSNLINVPPAKIVRYMNIYNSGATAYITKEDADRNHCEDRIACIRVEFEEWQYDQ